MGKTEKIKIQLFENKIDKLLSRLTKKKVRRHKLPISGTKEGISITTGPRDT